MRLLLEELKTVVLVNRDAGHPGTPVVAADHQTALADLLNLLYGYGHRSLVYLSGAPQSASNARPPAALQDFHDNHPEVALQTLPCGFSITDGNEAVGRALASRATAVLAFNG